MASRNVNDLRPNVARTAERHLELCAEAGIDLLVYCTLRDAEEQARLFRRGRTAEQTAKRRDRLASKGYHQLAQLLTPPEPLPGPKVTNAGPGESFHQYGLAYDCVPMVGGKCLWKTTGEALETWTEVGELGKQAGCEWAGEWTRFREFPHFQIVGDRTIADVMGEHYGAAQPSVLTPADLAPESEETLFRNALDEPNTKFFVVASVSGVSEQVLARIHSDACLARNLNPAVRRVFWLRRPEALSTQLRDWLWQGAQPAPATVASLGTGTARTTRTYTTEALVSMADVLVAFSWEP